MRDPFQNARAMHQSAMGVAAPASPAPPSDAPAPPALAQMSGGGGDQGFQAMAKQFGVDKLKLDKNPVIARTQLLQHLRHQFGPQFMNHPGVSEMMDAFNHQSVPEETKRDLNSMTSGGARTLKGLMGIG